MILLVREMDPSTDADDLTNASVFVPKPSRYTAFYDANGNNQFDYPVDLTSIDHILISPALADKVEVVEI